MRIAVFVVAFLVLISPGFAQTGSIPRFRLELRYPSGGSSMNLLELYKPATSAYPFVHTRTDASGPSAYSAYLLTEFEPVSIRPERVVLRYRLKWFEGVANTDGLFKQLAVTDLSQVMDTVKVPWRTMTYIPGQVDEIALDGVLYQVTGCVVSDRANCCP